MASPLAQSQFIFFSRRVAEGTEFSPRNINTPNTLLSLKKIITLRALGVLCGSARGQKNLREEKDVSLMSVLTVLKTDCIPFVERGSVSHVSLFSEKPSRARTLFYIYDSHWLLK